MEKILIIDDDEDLCELVSEYLETEGFQTETTHDGESGVVKALEKDNALVILDVMLPKLNGFEVLKKIRTVSGVPVLMLTARGDDVDRIVGLEIGADDYLPKPFNPRELVARIRAVLRRYKTSESSETVSITRERLVVDDVVLDVNARSTYCNEKEIDLTSVEFDLLKILLRSAGNVLNKDEIAREVLGRELSPFDRSIDMHVSNLRKKLGARPDGSERIKTIRSVGYIYTTQTR